MPTVIYILGWRLFFYSNEGNEPIHIHAEKAEMECKYWLIIDKFEIEESYTFNMNSSSKKEIRKIIFNHYELIVYSWNKHFKSI
jgi:hypothetical protein